MRFYTDRTMETKPYLQLVDPSSGMTKPSWRLFVMHHDPGLNNIMGRKRKQGKARKAAKAKQEAEERDNHTNDERRQPPAAQIQQWQSGIPKCTHGFDADDPFIYF